MSERSTSGEIEASETDVERSPSQIALPVPLGSILAGKYRVDAVIASGGMGIVARGEHVALAQQVAIKFLRGSGTPESIARLSREAQACARIQSDHIARVFDIDTLADGMPFMVMEYLEGTDLSVVLKGRVRLPVGTAVEYVLQACEALAEAHRQGIIHRDLKPANLFLTERPDGSPLVKVLDFGISKFRSRTESSDPADELTTTNSMMGSPSYMSPEQLRSARSVDARTDVWALGAVLYKLVAGRNPFTAETTPDLCIEILTEPVPPVVEAPLPDGFFAVLRWCLEKDVARRCANVAELAVALRPFASPAAARSIDRVVHILNVSVPAEIRPPVYLAPVDVPTDAPSVRDSSVRRQLRARRNWIVGFTSLFLTGASAVALLVAGRQHRVAPLAVAPEPIATPAALASPPAAPTALASSTEAPSVPSSAPAPSALVKAPVGPSRRSGIPARGRTGSAGPSPAASEKRAPASSAVPEATDEFGSFGPRK